MYMHIFYFCRPEEDFPKIIHAIKPLKYGAFTKNTCNNQQAEYERGGGEGK
jgi:hypothetical protein